MGSMNGGAKVVLRRSAGPTALALLLASAALVRRQDPDPAAVELRLEPVAGAVHCLYGQGGNIGISHGPDGLLVVDDQFDWLAPRIEGELRALAGRGPDFLVNTHFHGDHTGGNAHFGKTATLVAHRNVRKRLAEGSAAPGESVPPAPPEALPVVTFDEGLSIHANGEEIRLLHFPNAHTDGDVAVWFTGSKVLHLGDLFFAGSFPFVDTQSGGSVRGLIAALERIQGEIPADTRIIPGHGEVCGVAELAEYHAMLVEVAERVAAALADGRTLADMQRVGLLDDLAPTWGKGFVDAPAFLAALVESLSGR